MLNKLKKQDNKGFTIIEVMIVLAIAGLIILIVLLAVPALQRNGRNTAIKNDGSALVAGLAEFASNNDGLAPVADSSSQAGSTVTINNAKGNAATARVQGSTAITFVAGAAAAAPTAGQVVVQIGAKCPTTVAGATVTTTAAARSNAVIYAIELASGTAVKCVDA